MPSRHRLGLDCPIPQSYFDLTYVRYSPARERFELDAQKRKLMQKCAFSRVLLGVAWFK